MLAFKVVRVVGEVRKSLFDRAPKYTLTYPIGKWVSGPAPLFVFGAGETFYEWSAPCADPVELWLCAVRGITYSNAAFGYTANMDDEEIIDSFWAGAAKTQMIGPPKTLAQEVRLLRCVAKRASNQIEDRRATCIFNWEDAYASL